jgi:spore germination protein YaaH
VVWFDNEASIRARLGLVDEYDLGGVSLLDDQPVFP